MSYPMTFRRFINRNALGEGDYTKAPSAHAIRVNTNLPGLPPHHVERLQAYEATMAFILGDLRRLEHDAMDEDAICSHIAARTGIDRDVVAAVLKEFISW